MNKDLLKRYTTQDFPKKNNAQTPTRRRNPSQLSLMTH